jgi:DNA-binding transcriptional LysR family regulator
MLKPSIADLRAFVTVGELQSFAAAAQALHLSQPALSRRISHLEGLLGVRLFDRTTRSVSLTVLGQQFLGEVRGLVADLDRSVLSLRDAAELEAGDVTVGCVFSAVHHFLPPVIRAFRERYPRVLVRIIEEGADEVLASVKHGEADFAINYIGMQDPDVSFTPLLKEPYVLACPVGHPLAKRRSIQWAELAQYPLARVSHASRNRLFIDQALAELPPLPRPIIEVRHVSTLIGLVESGLGLAVVPKLTVPQGPGRIVGVRLENPAVSRTLALVQRQGRSLSPAAQAFAQMLGKAGRATGRR